jgi:hypothetical protein
MLAGRCEFRPGYRNFPFAFSPSATKRRMVWALSVLVYDVIDSVQPDKANEDEIDGQRQAHHARGKQQEHSRNHGSDR